VNDEPRIEEVDYINTDKPANEAENQKMGEEG
jgi:hypothetical protein